MTTKKMQMPIIEDQLWRAHVASEEAAAESWNTKWGWILKEHEYVTRFILIS